jgi:hypothetical protein
MPYFEIFHTMRKIEVACLKSRFPDVAGTEDGKGKENTPKEEKSRASHLGHRVKNLMTVI